MFSEISAHITNNKNLLMLSTVLVYILALAACLHGFILLSAIFVTAVFIFLILKDVIPIKYVIIWVLIFYIGLINTVLRLKEVDELLNLAPVNGEVTGAVISIPQGIGEDKPRFFVDANTIKFGSEEKELNGEKILVTLNSTHGNQLNFGGLRQYESYKFRGRLSVPFKAGNPSQFDYGDYLRNHNAYAVFYANEYERIEGENQFWKHIMQKIAEYRERVMFIHSEYMKSPNLEILGGVVFGDDAVSPPKDIKQSFVNSGLLHILAASGMNVAFIYGFFYVLMSLFRINYRVKVILGMVMVVVYAMMTGLGASVIRAACMLLFVLAGKLIDRDAHSIALLSFVAFLMLLYNPLWINDVGFQLSFIVTLGILVMAPAFTRSESKILDYIISSVTIPIIAQLWVIPVQIFYFNNISLYSIFANIMSVPTLMVVSFGGFVSSLLAGLPKIGADICGFFDLVLNPAIGLLVNISDFWGRLPHSSLITTHPCVFQIVLYYGILLCLSGILYKEIRERYMVRLLKGAAVLFIIWLITLLPVNSRDMEITVWDVGNADCFTVKTPDDKYVMIDTGKGGYNGGKSQAEVILLKYFKDLGIRTLDSIIVTHFDNDHCGGAVDLMKGLRVNSLYVNDTEHDSISARAIYKTARDNGTKIVKAENNQVVYNRGGLKLTNYVADGGISDNANSVITLLEYGKFTMLFTGDAMVYSLDSVKRYLPTNITVLKVPHHGAVGGINKELIGYFNPEYSVVSTGENKFGHPSVYTLDLLKDSKVLRTDVSNSIRFRVNKHGFRVYGFDDRRRRYVPVELTR